MPINFLKVSIPKPAGLRPLIHRHLAGYRKGRDFKNLHASDITKQETPFCPRERAMQLRDGDKPKDEAISTSLNVTFDIGRFVERRAAEWFAEMGLAVGDWDCLHCGRRHNFCKRPIVCSREGCGHKHFHYVEVRIKSEASGGVSCGIDMLLALPDHKLHTPVEIKSIDKDQFKALIAPLAEHGVRTKLYLRLLAETDDPRANLIRHDQGYVLYVSKGGFGTACPEIKTWDFWDDAFSPIKDYPVMRDDASVQSYVDKAIEVDTWRKTGKMPGRICQSSLDKRAKWCPKQTPCFTEKV